MVSELTINKINELRNKETLSTITVIAISSVSATLSFAKAFPTTYLAVEFGLKYSPILATFLGIGTGIPLLATSFITSYKEIIGLKEYYSLSGCRKFILLTGFNFFSSFYSYYISEIYAKKLFKETLKLDDDSSDTLTKILSYTSFTSALISANWSLKNFANILISKYYIYNYKEYKDEYAFLENLKKSIYKNVVLTQEVSDALINVDVNYFLQFSNLDIHNDIKKNIFFAIGAIFGGLAPWSFFAVEKKALAEVPREWDFTLSEDAQYTLASIAWISLGSLRILATINIFDKIYSYKEAYNEIKLSNADIAKIVTNLLLCGASLSSRVELANNFPIDKNNQDVNNFGIFASTAAPFFLDAWSINMFFSLFSGDQKMGLIETISHFESEIYTLTLGVLNEPLLPIENNN